MAIDMPDTAALDTLDAAPDSAPAPRSRRSLRDNGGKTELCVIFSTGALQVIKTEA